jgi:hypothetical protein
VRSLFFVVCPQAKLKLIEDWERITRERKLVTLPHKVPISTILDDFVAAKARRTSHERLYGEVRALAHALGLLRSPIQRVSSFARPLPRVAASALRRRGAAARSRLATTVRRVRALDRRRPMRAAHAPCSRVWRVG